MRCWMSRISFIPFAILLMSNLTDSADAGIRVNTIGFFPSQEKRATFTSPSETFSVVRVEDSAVVYEGEIARSFEDPDSGETVYIADFSALTDEGEYELRSPSGERSPAFRISAKVFNFPYYTVIRGMYLWRCGTAVSGTHDGIEYSHDACHLDDAYLDYVGEEGVRKDGTKGWHDAGDYNKYIVNSGITVGMMFHAWEHFPQVRDFTLDIPETGGSLPDFLAEMKWQMDWALTMQAPDGSVYHKLSALRFCGYIMPEDDDDKRYFSPWGSAATASFTAMTAMAARIFEPYDAEFAQQCRDAALTSYRFLQENPEQHRPDQSAFSTGQYNSRDDDDRLWAAAEMWQTFGDAEYLNDFETRARDFNTLIDTNWDWSNVKNLGMFTYLLSEREGKDPALFAEIRDALIADADGIVATAQAHGFERPLGNRYYWGCNGTVARQSMNLLVANQLSPKREYVETTLAALGHLFGRNIYGRSYVTGLGHNPPLRPHDRRSGADDNEAPWPGYLVGGGHSATGWNDEQSDYRTNEIAINWNGALIYALAAFVEE